jgi:hypothetical protein
MSCIVAVYVMDLLDRDLLNEQDLIRLYGTNHTRNDFFYTDLPLERFLCGCFSMHVSCC